MRSRVQGGSPSGGDQGLLRAQNSKKRPKQNPTDFQYNINHLEFSAKSSLCCCSSFVQGTFLQCVQRILQQLPPSCHQLGERAVKANCMHMKVLQVQWFRVQGLCYFAHTCHQYLCVFCGVAFPNCFLEGIFGFWFFELNLGLLSLFLLFFWWL